MVETRDRRKCLVYAAGPGDVVKTFQSWNSGVDDPHQVALTYSGQFFQACKELGVRGVAISSNPRVDGLRTDQFMVENRPKGGPRRGLNYHRQQFAYAKGLVQTAMGEGADVLIAAESTGHLFALHYYAPQGLAILPTIHCTLWPKFKELDTKQRLFNFCNKSLFSKRALGMLAISEDIRRQLQLITGDQMRPVHRFRPCYRRETFESIPVPDHDSDHFHILFAGRLEENKGIFDLVDICDGLGDGVRDRVIWDIAGDGSREKELRDLVTEKGLGNLFRIHGYCQRGEMLDLIGKSHAFIVPTRTEFEEGFNKVVAESILTGRPVLTSEVCPAIDDVRPAVVEARPNTIHDYCKGVELLVKNPSVYREKLAACKSLQDQFYDPANSWQEKLKLAVEGIL